eukprot:GHVU01092301.1.p3 GENE.GHVU01092301.1~~GHVU01092301.1.p3  ORF type:complete len:118 (-),score=9.69 GHVU01092301.1:1865-2218(-)
MGPILVTVVAYAQSKMFHFKSSEIRNGKQLRESLRSELRYMPLWYWDSAVFIFTEDEDWSPLHDTVKINSPEVVVFFLSEGQRSVEDGRGGLPCLVTAHQTAAAVHERINCCSAFLS